MSNNVNVEEAATAVANEIVNQIDAALAQAGQRERRPYELVAASQGLDAEAAALADPEQVAARVEALRAQLAQLTDPDGLATQRSVMTHAAERLREAANGGGVGK
jgi:polyhydroxyalkanoate synthesis regulator phasin